MMLTKKQADKLFQKYRVNTLYLFGSRATGANNALSDYDFAVILDDKVNPSQYGKYKVNIISELLRIIKTEHIDLIILNNDNLPLLLKYNIIKEGRVILEKNKEQRVLTETNILRRWLDWQYFEKMWGDIYIEQAAAGKFNN